MSPSDDPRCRAKPTINEVRDEAGTRGIEVIFHVGVAPDPLLAILWDVANFGRLFPDIKETTVRRSSGGDPPTVIELAYRVDAVMKEVRYTLRRELDPGAREITWREVSGDLKRVRGGWLVRPTDAPGVSLTTYRAFVDIGTYVPTWIVAKSAKRKAAEMVDRVRRVAVELAEAAR